MSASEPQVPHAKIRGVSSPEIQSYNSTRQDSSTRQMQNMGSAETSQQLEELFDNKKKPVKNPFVPIGACLLPILFLFFLPDRSVVASYLLFKIAVNTFVSSFMLGSLGKFHLGLFDVANRLLLK